MPRLGKRTPRILIVCEGAKTEPNYFEGARSYFKLNTANVVVSGESGSVTFLREGWIKCV